jgi:hypothetical protein
VRLSNLIVILGPPPRFEPETDLVSEGQMDPSMELAAHYRAMSFV